MESGVVSVERTYRSTFEPPLRPFEISRTAVDADTLVVASNPLRA